MSLTTTTQKSGLKYDDGKLRYDLLDPILAEGVARVLTFGVQKYADNTWQTVKPFKDRYYAALMRHIVAWRKGEYLDSESNIPHLAHAACNLYFLMWGDKHNPEVV